MFVAVRLAVFGLTRERIIMRFSRICLASISILVVNLHAASALASSINVTSAYSYTGNSLSGSTFASLLFHPDITVTNSVGGNTNVTEFQQSANAFTMTMDYGRTGTANSYVESAQIVNFTANANVDYSFSGKFSFTTPSALIAGFLYDFADGYQFFTTSYTNSSFTSAGGTFNFNSTGSSGGQVNSTFHPLTGSLVSNHHYVFISYGLSQASPNADSGATASGSTTLAFGNVIAAGAPLVAPVPSTVFLGTAMLGGLGVVHVLRRRNSGSVA